MADIDSTLLKERVKDSVQFRYFRDGSLWYSTADNWVFQIPVSDTSNAQGSSPTFNATEKGITLMRWIRKAMEVEAENRREAAEAAALLS